MVCSVRHMYNARGGVLNPCLGSLRSKCSCALLAKRKPRIGKRTSFGRAKIGESAKNKARWRGRGEKGTLASNHCESQILRSPANGASDWFKIGQMIETRLLLVIDYFKMANDEEDLQRALDFLAQKGFDRELKEEQKSAILQLMRGGDLLGVLPTGFGNSLSDISTSCSRKQRLDCCYQRRSNKTA